MGLAVLLFLACAGIATSQQSKIPAKIWEEAEKTGVARVIVGLNVPWQPEGNLSEADKLEQRQAIAAAQDQLLAEFVGTQHRVVRRFDNIPGLALEVGVEALAIMEHSAYVTKVTEDSLLEPGLPRSEPKGIP